MNIQQATPEFNAAMFWADKPIKKFVCTLRGNGKTETRIYGASNSDRAAALALENTDLDPEVAVILDIHLATPSELGCVPVTALSDSPIRTKEQKLQFQCQQLGSALAQCVDMMQCRISGNNIDTSKWMLVISNASKALKEGK